MLDDLRQQASELFDQEELPAPPPAPAPSNSHFWYDALSDFYRGVDVAGYHLPFERLLFAGDRPGGAAFLVLDQQAFTPFRLVCYGAAAASATRAIEATVSPA